MNIQERSLKYVEFHMFETFPHIFQHQLQKEGYWHEQDGTIRYECVVENAKGEEGNEISYIFPIFDPETKFYDNYNTEE